MSQPSRQRGAKKRAVFRHQIVQVALAPEAGGACPRRLPQLLQRAHVRDGRDDLVVCNPLAVAEDVVLVGVAGGHHEPSPMMRYATSAPPPRAFEFRYGSPT